MLNPHKRKGEKENRKAFILTFGLQHTMATTRKTAK